MTVKSLAQWFLRRKCLKRFLYMCLCKTSDIYGRAIFTLGYNLNTRDRSQDNTYISNIKGLGLLISHTKIFKVLSIGDYVKELIFRKKKVTVNPVLSFFKLYRAYVPKAAYQVPGTLALWFRRTRFLKCFYRIWAWWSSWSCDLDAMNKFSFLLSIEAPYEIWLWLVQWFLRRKRLKSVEPVYTTSSPMSLKAQVN